MPNAFNFSASPFDCLTPEQQRLVRASVDVAYYPEGETILDVGAEPSHLFIIIKGFVTQYEGDEVITIYGPDDTFDGRGLVAGKTSSRFVAQEEVVAYQLSRQAVKGLIADNATFGALLFSDLSNKLTALSERQSQHELQSLTLSRVDQAFVRPAHFVEMDDDVLSVVKVLQDNRAASVLVRDRSVSPERLGIFTATTLQRVILHGAPLDQQKVGAYANFSLITIGLSDQVGDALAMLMRHRVHRLVVLNDAGEAVGILEALDLFSFLSNHSHLITMQMEAATNIEGLAQASAQITRMVATLYRSGTRVSLIARLVQDLNARLFERAWQLIAPPDLVANSCLFVMGSEGRGEQLLKTDQDNGLILRDGYTPPDNLVAICNQFSQALTSFGYPECPGHIMVNNPLWRKTASDFGYMVKQWLLQPSAESLMNLAIFLDAHAVCGDVSLLEQTQQVLMRMATDNQGLLARFAASIDAFGSQGWWNRLLGLEQDKGLHLKKEGIFPLVHGVRSLALAEHLSETGTVARINALVAAHVLSAEMGADLIQSLHFLMGLKLKAGLTEMDTGHEVTGSVDVNKLSTLERDLLKDALGAVKHFKTVLRSRFKLDAL
jgi:CBS domain-containing protein